MSTSFLKICERIDHITSREVTPTLSKDPLGGSYIPELARVSVSNKDPNDLDTSYQKCLIHPASLENHFD